MNRCYRVVWSARRNAYVAAAENVKSHGKTKSAIVQLAVAGTMLAMAGEAAATVCAGSTTISGTVNAQCNLNQTGQSVTVTSSGTINRSSGTAVSVASSTTVGEINNAGTIESNTQAGGAPIVISGNLGGGLYNSGTIANTNMAPTSTTEAVTLNQGSTVNGITNSSTGTMSAYQSVIRGTNATITGGITNAGTLTSKYFSLVLNSIQFTGDISNSGLIDATDGGTSIGVSGGPLNGNIVNSGTIHVGGTSGTAISVSSGSVVTGGITNTGTISSSGYGISLSDMTLSQGIVNSGSITGTSGAGIFVSGQVTSNIENSGSITGAKGILVGITSNYNDYSFFSGSPLQVTAATLEGSISNSGTITGTTGAGISIFGGELDGSITNAHGGSIIGATNGVEILAGNWTSTYYYTSAGTFLSRAGVSGTVASGMTGGITNSGLIQGGTNGILVEGSTIGGSISNLATGTISGGANGVSLSSATVQGNLSNAGLIEGGVTGVNVSAGTTIAGGIINSGTLSGGTNAIYVSADSHVGAITIEGTSARVIGNVDASTTNFDLAGGAVFSSEGTFNVANFDVASGSVFNMANAVTASGGLSNNGTVNVGSTTQSLTGNYAQASGAIFKINLPSATSGYGRLAVTGNATVANGSVINVNVVGSPSISNGTVVQSVISATGRLSVDPNAINVTDNSALYDFTASTSRDAQDLDLITKANSAGISQSVLDNHLTVATGAANSLQQIFNTGSFGAMQGVFDRLSSMTSSQVANAVAQTLPAVTGATSSAGMNALHSMNKVIQSRNESNAGLSSGDATPDRFMWVRAFGDQGSQDDLNGVSGFKSDTGGIVFGGDAPVTDRIRAGGALTYADSSIRSTSSDAPSHVSVNTFELVGYASYNLSSLTDVNYQLDVGRNDATSHRTIGFMGETADADFSSADVHTSIGVGHTLVFSPTTTATPSVRLDYTFMRTQGYTESGAGPLNLDVDASTYRELVLSADAKMSHNFTDTLKVLGNAGIGYDFLNKQGQTTSIFVGGGPAFVTNGLFASPWIYRAGAALIKEGGKGVEYSLRYDLEARTSGYLNQTLSARVRWAF